MSIRHISSEPLKYAAVLAAFALSASVVGPTLAADRGGECCADLEERVAELEAATAKKKKGKLEVSVTGVVHRAVLIWDDGNMRRINLVDPAVDSTGIAFEGGAKIGNGWRAGYKFKFDTNLVGSDDNNQLARMTESERFKIDRSFVYIEQEKLGNVAIGFNKSASRSIDNMEFTAAESTDAAIDDWMGGFSLRTKGGELLDLHWNDFLLGKFSGKKTHLVVYTSPKVNGFELSASHGSNDMRDVALRYNQEFAKTWKFKAGIGYYHAATVKAGKTEQFNDQVLGGSVALLHIPTGLNIAYNTAAMSHGDACAERGALSDKCRGNDIFHYFRGGVVREFNSLGKTAFYGEHYRSTTRNNLSDVDTITALAITPTATTELQSTQSRVWGLGVTQYIDKAEMQIYAGYRHHTLSVSLADAAGPVADKGLKPFDLFFTGLRIEF